MATPRLTPKQAEQFLAIADHWGHCFIVYYSFGYLVDRKMVQKASAAEIEAHYAGLARDLEQAHQALVWAIEARDYKAAKDKAMHAASLAEEIAARAEDADRLAVLSPLGLAIVEKIKARRAAAQLP